MRMNFIVVLWVMMMTVRFGIPSSQAAPAAEGQVLVEAEAFQVSGGWVLDQEFMDQMGSPYLLAHGLGEPVKDAETTVKVEKAGTYKLWVRTKDWVAQWGAPGAPGKFQVLVNGQAVPMTFGTEGAQWHWQDGGKVALPAGEVKLALHDLTGFEGRCDAILFSADPTFTPPNELKAMDAWRRQVLGLSAQPEDGGTYDLVVVGAGLPGLCAAINAARLGLKVALVQDRAILGGNASTEVKVGPGGDVQFEPYPHIGDVVMELCPTGRAAHSDQPRARREKGANVDPRGFVRLPNRKVNIDDVRMNAVKGEKNIALFSEYHVNEVQAEGKKIQSVVAQNTRTAKRIRLAGKLFADCTGDGTIGALAGADFQITQKQHMGPTNVWWPVKTGQPAPFPRCPWALDLSGKPFPGRGMKIDKRKDSRVGLAQLGRWFWESGFDWDPVNDVEKMRDYNLRAMYGAWDTLKNVDKLYPTYKLSPESVYIAGKRESRRLMGDVLLDVPDFMASKKWEDACYPCTWTVDVHYPEPKYIKGFEGNAFISYCTHDPYPKPYWAPYRTLYSRNIGNLFMAGRDISVTHDAMGPTRLMRTGGAMGEVIGMAAALCVKHDTTPRGIYEKHLDELKALMTQGAPRNPVPDSANQ